MKRAIPALLLLSILSGAQALAATAGPEGLWRTSEDNAEVKIEPCGGALCGRLFTSDRLKAHPDQTDARNQNASLRSRPLKGLLMIQGLTGGPTEWSGGSLYNPADGRTYHGSLKVVDADTLTLTGCVFRPLCLTKTWVRVTSP